jgi:SAM-dependent methyltransferase
VAADVAAHAEVGGLDVVDVVPADLATDDALELLRSVDPSTYRGDRLARGVSARQAIAARPEALERARLTAAGDLDPVALDRAAVALKHVAAWTSDLGVAPGLHAPPTDPDRRLGYLRHRFGGATAVALASGFAGYALLAVGLVVAPVAGLAALAAWCLQPLIALVGTPLHPPDLLRRSALRWILGPVDLLRTARGTWRPAPDPRVPERDSLRAGYAESLADGTDRFFEARRTDCPVCGSSRLVTRLTTVDLVQHKPGRFEIDRCEACGHLFQNPQLTVEGLEFYYRDVYDGLGEERGEFMFRSTPAAYRSRAAMLPPEARPGRWLDVGTGHGHFPLVAAEQWPDTVFEGLDISESIEEADRRGWVSEGYRGLLLDRAPELAGRYDVVSMFHYLEHTRDPVAELDAVTGLLTDGGYLLIELPDPDAAYADLVGPYWFSWLQPQHLHFLNRARLCTLLEARGYEIVSSGPAGSYPISELTAAWWLLMNRIGPETGLPWRPPPTGVDYARRIGVLALGSPVLLLAEGAGRLLSMVVPSFGNLNVFQVVARKP